MTSILWLLLLSIFSLKIVLFWLPEGLKIVGAASALLFLLMLIHSFLTKTFYSIVKGSALFVVTFGLLFLSWFWSHDADRTAYELMKITPGILIYFTIVGTGEKRYSLSRFKDLFVFCSLAVIFLSAFLIHEYGSLRRSLGGSVELRSISGSICEYSLVTVPVLYGEIRQRAGVRKAGAFVLLVGVICAAVLSGTRTGLAAGTVLLLLLGVHSSSHGSLGKRMRSAFSVPFGLVVAGMVVVALSPTAFLSDLADRYMGVFHEADVQEMGRYITFTTALGVIADNPLLGVGYEAFTSVYSCYGPMNPHNVLLDFGTAAGVPGIILLVLLITSTGLKYVPYFGCDGLRGSAYFVPYYFISFVTLCIFGLFWQILFNPFLYLFLGVGKILGQEDRKVPGCQTTNRSRLSSHSMR